MKPQPSVLAKSVPDSAQLEAGRLLFAAECRFVTAAATLDGLPAESLPEVAFLGRSNVGKSSLINALTGRATLARISNTPGRTRQLNFFALGRRLLLVDMPGYGYANAAKTEIERWNAAIDAYLRGRAGLRRLCLLIDARHGLKPNDVAIMDWLDRRAVIYQIVLTKLDKLKANERQDSVVEIDRQIARRPAAFPAIAATSSESGLGIPELRAMLCELALPRQPLTAS